MASALLAGSPQTVFAEVNGVQTVMQTGTVKGQVVDANGEPIIGASVLVKVLPMVRLLILMVTLH